MPEVHVNAPDEDDELEELPPIDGEPDEPLDEEDDDLDASDAGGLDDATGEDDPLEEEDFGDDESSALGDDADGPAQAPDELAAFDGDAAPFAEGDDAPGIAEDFGVDEPARDVALNDGGEEGLDEDGDELRALELPPLDADDEAEHTEEGFFDRLAEAGDDLSWAPHPWELVFASAQHRLTALAAADGGAYVFAERLLWISERGEARPLAARGLDGAVASLVATKGALDAMLDDGRLARSTDDGASFAAVDSSAQAASALDAEARLEASGRSLVVVQGRIVADVSNDADVDGEEARVIRLDRRGELVWVATPAAVLLYRAR